MIEKLLSRADFRLLPFTAENNIFILCRSWIQTLVENCVENFVTICSYS